MLWGTRPCGLLAVFAMLVAAAMSSAEAATIHYDFSGPTDTAADSATDHAADNALADLGGPDGPAGAAFSVSFNDEEAARELGGGPAPSLQRRFAGEAFSLAIAGIAEPLFAPQAVPGSAVTSSANGMASAGLSQPVDGEAPARAGFLDSFPSAVQQVLNPLLLLPEADDLTCFALAAIALGEITALGGITALSETPIRLQGTVTNVLAAPLPPAAWLFLTAIAGLAIIRVRRY